MSLSCFELGEQMLSVDAAREALMTLVASPVATATTAGAPPLYGTCVISMAAIDDSSSIARCVTLPTPPEP